MSIKKTVTIGKSPWEITFVDKDNITLKRQKPELDMVEVFGWEIGQTYPCRDITLGTVTLLDIMDDALIFLGEDGKTTSRNLMGETSKTWGSIIKVPCVEFDVIPVPVGVTMPFQFGATYITRDQFDKKRYPGRPYERLMLSMVKDGEIEFINTVNDVTYYRDLNGTHADGNRYNDVIPVPVEFDENWEDVSPYDTTQFEFGQIYKYGNIKYKEIANKPVIDKIEFQLVKLGGILRDRINFIKPDESNIGWECAEGFDLLKKGFDPPKK